MKRTRKILNVVFILMIIITIIVINRTYALFESNIDISVNMDVARWHITVNDVDVNSETVESFVIQNLQLEANSKVVAGKVAPGSKGSYDVEMDFKDTDVSVQGEINIDEDKMDELGLKFNGFTMDDTSITLTKVSDAKYTFIVPLSKIQSATNSYKLLMNIEFEWENDETRNKEDTQIGTSSVRLKMGVPITLKFTQYTG